MPSLTYKSSMQGFTNKTRGGQLFRFIHHQRFGYMVVVSRLSKRLLPMRASAVVSLHIRKKHIVPLRVTVVVSPHTYEKRLLPMRVSVAVMPHMYEKTVNTHVGNCFFADL